MSAFRNSPAVRFWVRVVVVAAIGYLAAFFTEGKSSEDFDTASFLWGLGGAVFSGLAYALIGGTTPMEPFVGVNKVEVEVPVPPADPVRR